MNPMKMLSLKPSSLKDNVANEGKQHKAKIICFAALMAATSAYYQSYFENVVYRSGQW